jgi:hypothetical protein
MRMMAADDHSAGQLFTPPRNSAETAFPESIHPGDEGYRAEPDPTSRMPSKVELNLQDIGIDYASLYDGGFNQKEFWESIGRMSPDGSLEMVEEWEDPYAPIAFENWVNPKDGIIIATSNFSPAAWFTPGCLLHNDKIWSGILPKLCYWSDVVFLQWLQAKSDYRRVRGKSGSQLKYVLRDHIANTETRQIIDRVVIESNVEMMAWPGLEISAESTHGKALLGSPNGAGVGYLLAQHKRQLRHKIVDRINIFVDKVRPDLFAHDYHLLFVLKDVEQDDEDEMQLDEASASDSAQENEDDELPDDINTLDAGGMQLDEAGSSDDAQDEEDDELLDNADTWAAEELKIINNILEAVKRPK